MRGATLHPIVIAAGGTGGHFFPAEALADELARRNRRVVLMTDARSAGFNSAAFEGRERFVISGAGIAGRGAVRGALAVAALAAGALQARAILQRLNAAAVVGFGGYPSVPPVLATRLLRTRPAVILHEQNAVLGRANCKLARHADRIALSFPATARLPEAAPARLTGNPVRPAMASRPYQPAAPDEPIRILVLGGSLGARVLSDVVPTALMQLPAGLRGWLSIAQQCRPEDLGRVRAAYTAAAMAAELDSFFPDVADRLAAAHLVIARAGASTVAELAAVGRPAVLVPLPGAIDDHQAANARALAAAGAAWVIPQSDFTAATLAAHVARLLGDPAELARAARAAAGQARPDAAQLLADLVSEAAEARLAPLDALPWGRA